MEKSARVREQIKDLDFLEELVAGTLPIETFHHYLAQDSLYLRQYSRVLALLAVRAPRPEITQLMASASNMTLVVEGALHENFLQGRGANAVPSPTCEGYTNFLLANAHNRPYEVAFASAIPCYTIYCEVGELMLRRFSSVDGVELESHPYAAWIQTYGGEAFETATRKAVAVLDELAAGTTPNMRDEMHQAFLQATRFEWMFWRSAYDHEEWPICVPSGHIPLAPTAARHRTSTDTIVSVVRNGDGPGNDPSASPPTPSRALWAAAAPAAAAALHGRFCSALAAGTLPAASFGAYIAQDYFFLRGFAEAYASAQSRLPVAYAAALGPKLAALISGVEDERKGHAENAAKWGVTDITSVQPMRATTEYCALLKVLSLYSL